MTIVETYSRCLLTRKTDKLIAFSGIASVFQTKLEDHYLFGIWASGIIPQLLWKRDTGHPGTCGRDNTRAPSWSWASVDVAIKFTNPRHAFVILHRASVEHHTFHAVYPLAGLYASDYIQVRGRLAQTPLLERIAAMEFDMPHHDRPVVKHLDITLDLDLEGTPLRDCFLLVLICRVPLLRWYGWSMQGLVVTKASGDEAVIFRRIGHFAWDCTWAGSNDENDRLKQFHQQPHPWYRKFLSIPVESIRII